MEQVRGVDLEGFIFYRVTERDLVSLVDHDYQVGEILIFTSGVKPRVGRECGRADNLGTAQTFAASVHFSSVQPSPAQPSLTQPPFTRPSATMPSPTQPSESLSSSAESLTEQLSPNWDDCLDQEMIRYLRNQNTALQAQLSEQSERIEQLSFSLLQNDLVHEELINELRDATSPTAVGAVEELDQVRFENATLIQELGFLRNKFTALEEACVVLEAENTTLEHELTSRQYFWNVGQQDADDPSGGPSGGPLDEPSDDPSGGLASSLAAGLSADSGFTTTLENEKETVLTDESGGTIRIYHEFPSIPRRSLGRRIFTSTKQVILVGIVAAASVYIFFLTSVIETMRSSGIDIGFYSQEVFAQIQRLLGL